MSELKHPLSDTGLNVRIINALARNGIYYLNDIKSMAQLSRVRNIGSVAIQEILKCFNECNLPVPPEVTYTDSISSRKRKRFAVEIAIDVLTEHTLQGAESERELFALKELRELLVEL